MPSDDSRPIERRAEPRLPADAGVILRRNGSVLTAVSGHVMDIAKSGFRARHGSRALRPGDIVEFELAGVNGRARVIWTRIAGGRVESGFLILTGEAV